MHDMSQPGLLEAMSGSFPKPAPPQLAHKGLSLITHKLMTTAEVTGINDRNKHSYHNKVKSSIFWIKKPPIITLNYGCTYKLQCIKAHKRCLAQVWLFSTADWKCDMGKEGGRQSPGSSWLWNGPSRHHLGLAQSSSSLQPTKQPSTESPLLLFSLLEEHCAF